jgi:tetratricopeptide (TPR) repeat protein/transcriptional regulator with XRE-family HTH domain
MLVRIAPSAGKGDAVTVPPVEFAGELRRLRAGAGLTQEELARRAGLSSRAISDLERGRVRHPQKDTVRLLADALRLTGQPRAEFEAAARGRAVSDLADGVAAVRTLPRDIASFTGRQRELTGLVDAVAEGAGAVCIHAIGGMAGVGKTAFAVHAAHQLAERFPGGQIFLPLHGHTPGQRPVGAVDALASLLLIIGVPAGQIPPGLEARIGLWRDRLSGRKLLLILDDASASEQIRPLLPGSGDSLVLVTSRRRLTALEDARAISLDTLPPGEAAGLLVRLAGRPGLGSADPAVAEIARLCGYLPLAIGMMARLLHHHPAWSVDGRAAELTAAVNRLELLVTENLSVAAALDLSYADLTADQQRLFRRLGLHPGADIDGYAAAALDGTGLAFASRGLEALYEQYLLIEPAPGRYRMHDLIREHAQTLAGRLDREADRGRATERLLDYYQHTSVLADALLARLVRPAPARPAGVAPAAIPVLSSREQALVWARAERANLLACLDHAAATGRPADVIVLTAGLAGLLEHDGPWTESINRHDAAVRAARRLGDKRGQAGTLTNLGDVRRLTGDHPGAARDLEEALRIYRATGYPLGQAGALTSLGIVRQLTGDYPAAVKALEEALSIYRAADDRRGQAYTLTYLGRMRLTAGDYPAAAQDLQEALVIHGDTSDRLGQAGALNSLGCVRRLTGHYPAAIRDLEEALSVHRALGYRLGQAHALTDLGDARRAAAEYQSAARDLGEALSIYCELGDRLGQAHALAYLGDVRRLTGDHPGAGRDLQQALGILRGVGDPHGEVTALNAAGTLSRADGDLDSASSYHRQALNLARQIGSPRDEAHALAGLGRCALAAGPAADAEAGLWQALAIFQRIGAAEAAGVLAELQALST